MSRKIRITMGSVALDVEVLATPTAEAVYAAVPFSARANTWGQEVYFQAPVSADSEPDAHDVVTAGEIAFWPAGQAIAIGFGRTPMSRGDEIRLASPVNVWARALGDVRDLGAVRAGDLVRVEAIEAVDPGAP